jgi:hypothetical protein
MQHQRGRPQEKTQEPATHVCIKLPNNKGNPRIYCQPPKCFIVPVASSTGVHVRLKSRFSHSLSWSLSCRWLTASCWQSRLMAQHPLVATNRHCQGSRVRRGGDDLSCHPGWPCMTPLAVVLVAMLRAAMPNWHA